MFSRLGQYSPGALLLRARQKFGHGVRAAWYRDNVRPRIVRRRPVEGPAAGGSPESHCEIHVLTSSGDWLNLLWVLHSLFASTQRRFALCIHDDGSLDEQAIRTLLQHVPWARVVRRSDADRHLDQVLASFPRCKALRYAHPLALKVFDFNAYLHADRMFMLDSDILFFDEPEALFARLDDPDFKHNTLNMDWSYGYSLSEARIREQLPDFTFISHINSGLGLIHEGAVRFDWAEEILGQEAMHERPHCMEQTITALCCARHGFTPLPDEYTVELGPKRPGQPVKHYTSPIRHLLYEDGIAALAPDLL